MVTAPHKTSRMSQDCLTNANGDKWGLLTVAGDTPVDCSPNKVSQSLRLHFYRMLRE